MTRLVVNHKSWILVTSLVFAGAVGLLHTTSVSAYACPFNRSGCNGAESTASSYPTCTMSNGQSGALWFNTSGSSPSSDGYYSDTVNVSSSATYVGVNIRGSVYACGDGGTNSVYALGVNPVGPNGGRLTGLGSTTLYRGTMTGNPTWWSTQGSSIPATLNVSGLAENNANSAGSQTINIDLYRCYSSNNVSPPTGSCYATPVAVNVVRAQLDYKLTPNVTTNPLDGNSVSPNDSVQVIPLISNSGPTASNPDNNWQLSQFIVNPGDMSYHQVSGTSSQPPTIYYGHNLISIGSGGPMAFGISATYPQGSTGSQHTVPDLSVGTKVCYVLSVQPYTQTTGDWAHSAPSCLVIGKKPLIQIWGSDLRVGAPFASQTAPSSPSIIDTSITTKSGTNTYGSWAEYGVFAPSKISGLASLSGLAGDSGNVSSSQSDWSKLTFANQPTTNCPLGFGCYNTTASMGTIPDVESRFFTPGSPDTGGALNLNQGSGVHTYKITGDLNIPAATIQAGQSYVIKATGTVTISGNINYTSATLHSLSDIPQLVIIANNIYINSNVTNVDAWLIAEGTTTPNTGILDTCSNFAPNSVGNYGAQLTSDLCNKQLLVNGPVMAQHLWLRRTAGAGTGASSGDAGETFNLRSDAYLWAVGQAQGDGKAHTTFTKELPPLF